MHGAVWLHGSRVFAGSSEAAAARLAADELLEHMSRASGYALRASGGGYALDIVDAASVTLAEVPTVFTTVSDAEACARELVATCSYARSLIVEHLLLRPKFPGDAIYAECGTCEDSDPWSFRLTVVMPGWSAPYNVDPERRAFANGTIQAELPSHLLPKICWVGDEAWDADPCEPVVDVLTRILEQGAVTKDGVRPTCRQANDCAVAAYLAHVKLFAAWSEGKESRILSRAALAAILPGVFAGLSPAAVGCDLDLAAAWKALQAALVAHFTEIFIHRRQFTRFELAWYAWLEEDARFDWGEERLVERLVAILQRYRQGSATTELCTCAEVLVEAYGKAFSDWMQANLDQGRELPDFTPFVAPPVTLCAGVSFMPGTEQVVADFLDARYGSYTLVSYRLALLVRLLQTLTNTYPEATLHDCDDGSDVNPVRLNQTALGSLATGASEEIHLSAPPPAAARARRPRNRKP